MSITQDLLDRLKTVESRLIELETRAEIEAVEKALRRKRAELGLCPETGAIQQP